MTKADLVEKVAVQVSLTKKDTEVVIDTIFDSISQALASKNDSKVELRGFGSFRVRRRRARQGRNPHHAPDLPLSTPVPHQHCQQFQSIYPIRLGPSLSPVDFDAGWIHHDILYPEAFQIPVYPKPVSPRFITAVYGTIFTQLKMLSAFDYLFLKCFTICRSYCPLPLPLTVSKG